MRLMFASLAAVAALSAGSTMAAAEGQAPPPDTGATAVAFYQRVAAAVTSDDIDTLAELVNYPLLYGNDDNRVRGKPSEVENAAELRARYHQIFTSNIKRILACRTPADFYADGDGVTVGDGSLWFNLTYIGSDKIARPIDYQPESSDWRFRVIAVYSGAHARRNAEQCEAQQQ